ncbi:MAG: hypothetical protein IH874_05760 [Candidatus Dadabacteria bacterium]|nr:hypothetical protein [Candidatus Dadabacteria bacterium]
MVLKIFNSTTDELLAEIKSYTVSHYVVTGDDIIWAIWIDAPFSSPSDQTEPFRLHDIRDNGEETVYDDGWLKDVAGTRPDIAVRILSKRRTDS